MRKLSMFQNLIHFPGGYGQVRQMSYCFVREKSASLVTGWDTQIVFIEDESDPFKYDSDSEFINSESESSSVIPDYLLNKVLIKDLQGCDLEYIKSFFVSCPGIRGIRQVNEWVFRVDMNYSINPRKHEHTILDFKNEGERLLFSLGFHGIEQKPVRVGKGGRLAGIYPVRINPVKPEIIGSDKENLLDTLGLKSEDI